MGLLDPSPKRWIDSRRGSSSVDTASVGVVVLSEDSDLGCKRYGVWCRFEGDREWWWEEEEEKGKGKRDGEGVGL